MEVKISNKAKDGFACTKDRETQTDSMRCGKMLPFRHYQLWKTLKKVHEAAERYVTIKRAYEKSERNLIKAKEGVKAFKDIDVNIL